MTHQQPERMVILGNGMASLTAVRTLRQEGFTGQIGVISDEPHGTYARMLTPYFVSGAMDRDRMFMVKSDFHQQMGVELLLSSNILGVDAESRIVRLDGDRNIPYDRLLVATGSRPYLPGIPGIEGEGVLGLRSMADAEKMRRLARPGDPAVVVGAGLVSLMAAEALVARGMKVTVVMSSGRVLSQLLVPDAAVLVQRRLDEQGLTVVAGRDAVAVDLDQNGRVSAVRLNDGTLLPCRILVVGKGVVACTEPVQGTGCEIGKGIRTDWYLESTVPGIFAAGDVAEAPTLLEKSPRVVATQTMAIQQGTTAAMNMLGREVRDIGALPINYTHIGGVKVVAAGHTGQALAGDRQDIITGEGIYRRFLFREDRLVGITLVGDVTNASRLVTLIRRQEPVGDKLKHIVTGELAGWQRGEIWGRKRGAGHGA